MSLKTIEVEHLSKVYGSTIAIEDIHFSVNAGEIIGFLGPNGAGKTTTMRILAGYLPATAGTARIAGFDVHRQSLEARRHIGYLPEAPPLYPDMKVKNFLTFVAKIKGVRAVDRRRLVCNAMAKCQLLDCQDTIIRKLSKGYRQRVGIAQAIVHEPPVIILDEPTVGLDPRQIIEVRNLIKSLAGDHTIVLSTHILPEASTVCDRVTIINHGKVVTSNTPLNLQAQLSSSSGYEIEIVGNTNKIMPLISAIGGVTQVTARDIASAQPDNRHLLQISCTANSEPGKDIAATIVRHNIELHEMRRTRPTLEDVFLKLTTEESFSVNNQQSTVNS